ncbi:MAG: gamma-glutamylcyclotransferase [Bacteroidales bacterium]|nr:gamma-glutamylcyclotransferase [Bacteroidales bacterium]
MDKNTITLFVYGGLLKGMTLAPFIEGAKYLGPAFIKAKIYFLGQFPGIVQGDDIVFGELYELDRKELPALDKIEDYHPDNIKKSSYIRKKVEVNTLPGKTKIIADAYFYNRSIEKDHIYIAHGDYRRFIYEEEKENCWLINSVLGGKTNGVFKDLEQNLIVKTGTLQFIDTQKSNGSISLKQEKIQLIQLDKTQFDIINSMSKQNKEYLSTSVPFYDETGNIDVAIAVFKTLA